ncbi:hypothetical protein H4F17_13470 [Vibrio cholerae]
MATFTVMCVQPIEFSVESFQYISKQKISDVNYSKPTIDWINKFNNLHRRTKHFRSIFSKPEICSKYLISDLGNPKYFVFGEIDLSKYLVHNSPRFDLVYDERLSTFCIVKEFSLDICNHMLGTIFNDIDYDRNRNNFFNSIRNIMVKEHDESVIGEWEKEMRIHSISAIKKLFYKGKIDKKNLPEILNNTGNISIFVNGLDDKNVNRKIFHSNQMAERVESNCTTLLSNEDVEFNFHGRFHTIISNNKDYYYRFFPIQYHAQFMWNSVHSFNSIMDELNRKMLLGEFNSGKGIDLIDNYINKFELVRIHNQDMKMYFESDSELVFNNIEKKWTIKESLNEINGYISSFKEYTERSYQRKMEKSNQRQSKTLFIISCIQMLGLVSIWVDYLSLSKLESFVSSTGFVKGGEKGFLLVFNTWFPIVLLASLFILVYMVLFKRD